MSKKLLTDKLRNELSQIGIGAFISWLKENDVSVNQKNFFDQLEEHLQAESISLEDIYKGLAELEENSGKKIHLFNTKEYESLTKEKKKVLLHLRKAGVILSANNLTRVTPRKTPTFNYMTWEEEQIKIKYSEVHFDVDVDMENEKIVKIPKIVNILFVIDLKDGWTQIRFDRAGQLHTHKNDQGRVTEAAFENFYKDLLQKLFPDVQFADMNLKGVANYIATKERKGFRINKQVTTITGNAKQTYSMASSNSDVRDLPELSAAAATEESKTWLTEDLEGYWLASQSNGLLNKDLFMRISRRVSEVRVLRGCLEKELNYGLNKIREIQK